ncbi:glycoside hydrolase family 93 protein [Corynascus similis CBS 632.67]
MDPRVRRLHIAREDHFVHSVQGTYPRLCRLSDGSILAGFTSFLPGGQRALTIVRSTDEARTFQPHGEVTRSFNDCDNLFLLELPPKAGAGTSTILAAFRNHDLDRNGAHTYFRITVCRSTDGGRTWSFLSQAFEKPAPFGLWEPFLRMGADGREVQLYFSMELAMNDQDTMLVHSPDGGATWTTPRRVTGGGEALRDGMVGLAEARDCERGSGALVLVMETTRLGTFSVEAVVSFDDGHTFGCRQVVYAARKGRNAGAPQIAAFADGSVAVVFMTDEDEYSEPKWPRGAKIKAVFGTLMADGKLLWNPAQVVGDAMCSWPGIMRIADDAAVAVYETSASIRGRILRVGT